MKKVLLFAFILMLFASVPSIAAVYQWSDDADVIHLSDSYQTGVRKAKPIELPKPAISNVGLVTPPAIATQSAIVTPTSPSSSPDFATKNPTIHQKIYIKQPQDQETLQYNEGKISIILSSEPEIKGDFNNKIAIYLDGNKVMETKSLSFEIKNVARGEHTLQAKIINKDDTVLSTSSTITFYVHQTSISN